MPIHKNTFTQIATILMLTAIGCDSNENGRLAEMAERHLVSQADQNRRMAENQHQVAEGTRHLVESDAKAREAMVSLHRDVQAERVEIGQQRDALEGDRRQFASRRQNSPVIANAITCLGLLLACLLPLVLCWRLLTHSDEPVDEQALTEVLLEDLVADQPLLLERRDGQQIIDSREENDVPG